MSNTTYKPSISSAFSFGMELFKKVAGPMIGYWFIVLTIIITLFGVFFGLLSAGMLTLIKDMSSDPALTWGTTPITFFVAILAIEVLILGFWLGYHLYMDGVYNNQTEGFSTFFKGIKYTPKIILAYLLRFLIMLPIIGVPYYFMFQAQMEIMSNAGDINSVNSPFNVFSSSSYVISYIFILIAQTISYILFQFTTELIILSGMSVVEATKSSVKTSWKHFSFLFGLSLLLFIMNMAGYMFIGLGLIFTIPFSLCVLHVMYQKLFTTNGFDLTLDEFGDSEEDFGLKS